MVKERSRLPVGCGIALPGRTTEMPVCSFLHLHSAPAAKLGLYALRVSDRSLFESFQAVVFLYKTASTSIFKDAKATREKRRMIWGE